MRAHETLTKRGAGIVCVEQTIDMTTPEGRAFAQMLAVFAELEAAAISSRVVAARVHLLSVGRAPGGRAPYGWRIVPNPKGKGWIVAQDPERIDWVREMARRALRGDTVTMIVRWLDEAEAPFPFGVRRRADHWWHASVERLLHNPMLAGMIPYKPARQVVRPTRVQLPANRREWCSTPTAGRWSARTSPSSASPSERPSLRGSTYPISGSWRVTGRQPRRPVSSPVSPVAATVSATCRCDAASPKGCPSCDVPPATPRSSRHRCPPTSSTDWCGSVDRYPCGVATTQSWGPARSSRPSSTSWKTPSVPSSRTVRTVTP